MSRLIWIAVLGAALGGCGKADEGLKSLEGVKAAVCGCKPNDYSCAKDGLGKIAEWHEKYGEIDGKRSQAAKATAHLDAIQACQTRQVLADATERAVCSKLDAEARAKARWCRLGGWGNAKAVEPKDLPLGKALEGGVHTATIGIQPSPATPTTLALGGTAEAPTAGGVAMTADGAGWTWEHGGGTVELRKIDGGWMTLSVVGDARHVTVFDELAE